MQYQVLARRYRPQYFHDVVGQPAIVTTLKNAIKNKKVAHAYLFSGSRGTGKTTLARLLAKALNCLQPGPDYEPCNSCASCKEITAGCSLDVIEIDGASNRGIDEVRQIRETVGYSSSTGHYRIYIIDEVHMLTKEAFNALLKTLEEPPQNVKFLFATTEPHKVLPTIISRCQRFDLKRIPEKQIVEKLKFIAQDLGIRVDEEALHMIAARAAGGMRDAESLFDQLIAFQEEGISVQTVSSVLGMMSSDIFFNLDRAGKEGNLATAFEIVHQIFSEGKDLAYFLENLIEHFRTLLICKLTPSIETQILSLSPYQQQQYMSCAKLYTQEQCLTILDMLIEAQPAIKLASSPRIAIEALLLRIMRMHQRIPIEFLVRRLIELEQSLSQSPSSSPSQPQSMAKANMLGTVEAPPRYAITEDPSPSPADIEKKPSKGTAPKSSLPLPPSIPLPSIPEISAAVSTSKQEHLKQQTLFDNLLHFAAVELGGALEKKHFKL